MAIYETFSTRQKKLSKHGEPDPYCYDVFPQPLRVQVINLLNSTLGDYGREDYPDSEAAPRWDHIHRTLAHEYGVFELAEGRNSQKRCVTFFRKPAMSRSVLILSNLVSIGSAYWPKNIRNHREPTRRNKRNVSKQSRS